MSNNVVRITSESDSQSDIKHDGQSDLFNGQKEPAPFVHDPALLHEAAPAYYLKTETLATLLSHLQQVITGRGAIQVIIAEHGRGKSALIRQLITEAGSRWLLCHIQADYHLGVDHIINGLGQTFFPQEDVDFEALVHGLASYGHQEPYPVVIVDDAQNLSSYAIETLASLKRAVAENGGDLDIILCATPALREIIASYSLSPFRDEWLEVHSLPRFSEADTTTYLNHNFESPGDTTLFTPDQLQNIHHRGCGIPACINYHAELALGRAISDERLRLEHQQMLIRRKKQPYLIGGGVATILLLIVVIFSFSNTEQDVSIAESKRMVLSAPVAMSNVKQTLDEDEAVTPKVTPAAAKVVEKEVKSTPVTKPVVAAQVKPAAKPEPKPQPVKAEPEPTIKTAPTATLAKAESKPVVKSKPAVKPETNPVVGKSPAPTPAKENSVVAKPAAAVVAADEEAIPGAAWLKAQPPEHYSIQLAGSPDEKNIIRYIRRSALEGELAYVLLKRKNRSSWYVVLHGSFESRAAALEVTEFFPPELRKHKPWVRKLSKLQNALDEN